MSLYALDLLPLDGPPMPTPTTGPVLPPGQAPDPTWGSIAGYVVDQAAGAVLHVTFFNAQIRPCQLTPDVPLSAGIEPPGGGTPLLRPTVAWSSGGAGASTGQADVTISPAQAASLVAGVYLLVVGVGSPSIVGARGQILIRADQLGP